MLWAVVIHCVLPFYTITSGKGGGPSWVSRSVVGFSRYFMQLHYPTRYTILQIEADGELGNHTLYNKKSSMIIHTSHIKQQKT